jgi:hydrogenase expression/formation protein
MTPPQRILLLGVGNSLYSDEGIGVHAAQHLYEHYTFSENVALVEGGTLGKMLMQYLVECDKVIVMDAVRGGHEPGTMYRLENEDLRKSLGFCDSQHQVDLVDILIHCELVGNKPEAIVIGMEPADLTTLNLNLTEKIAEKMPTFIQHVLAELADSGGSHSLKKAPDADTPCASS